MSIHQNTNLTHPMASANLIRLVSSVWKNTADKIKARVEAARHERVVAKLPLHLRQDIGDLDCRPPAPTPLAEKLHSRQQGLESMWLRHFRMRRLRPIDIAGSVLV